MTHRIVLEGPQLEGLELLLAGLLPGVEGYGIEQRPGAFVPQLTVELDDDHVMSMGDTVEICDPDATALASLQVDAVRPDGGRVRLGGALQRLRACEHGPARSARLTADIDLSGATVAVFSPDPRVADIVHAVEQAGDGPLELIANGGEDAAAALRLLAMLQLAAASAPHLTAALHFGGEDLLNRRVAKCEACIQKLAGLHTLRS